MDEYKLWEKYGSLQKSKIFSVGPYYSYQFIHSPRHILFSMARYKFALKMIGEQKQILELGCSDGLGTYCLSEFATGVLGVDFDKESIDWAKDNLTSDNLKFRQDNFLGQKYGEFDAVVAYDVVEHIYENNEAAFFQTILSNLKETGIFIIGTPNIENRKFSKEHVDGAHVNMYSADRLIKTLNNYFNHVFLFSQNDEMIHTGFYPLAHYLLGLCCYKKGGN